MAEEQSRSSPPPAPGQAPPGDAPSAPAAPPTPDDPATAASGRNFSAYSRDGKRSMQAKVAGVMMMLVGAFFAVQLVNAGYALPKYPETYASEPGGNLTVYVPEHPQATVELVYRSGAPTTVATLDAGRLLVKATNATFDVRVVNGERSWTRSAFVPQGLATNLTLHDTDPPTSSDPIGWDTRIYIALYGIGALCAAIAVAGIFAFRLRGPRVALAGAFLMLVGATVLITNGLDLLTISLVATALMCFVFIYKARALFAPALGRKAMPE